MTLCVDDTDLPVSQVGGDWLILRDPTDIAVGTKANLTIRVDGKDHNYEITVYGVEEDRRWVNYQ